jgi:glycosyltransferase involved in cell wall biosynthesis
MNKKLMLVGSGGKSVHIKNYYNLIKDYFDEILVITDTEVDFCNFQKVGFSIRNPFEVRNNVKKLRRIMTEFNPSVVHVHQANSFAYITSLANKGKIPQVLTTWGSDVLLLPKQGVLLKHIVTYSIKHSHYVTADADFIAEAINKLVKKKVIIANFGIDYEPEIISKKLDVIYSNRLHDPLYRVDEIIKGFGEFIKENPSWKLIIGANGSETEALKLLAEAILPKESYEFIGFVNQEENKKNYLRAKLWVSNPESDGTAISLLEAMGYRCIPVVSDLPANREWIDGMNGIIIENSLAESFEKAVNLNFEKVWQKNQQLIEEKATKKVNREKFLTLYNQIIND